MESNANPPQMLTPAQQALLPVDPGAQPDSAYVDPDPATTYDPHPGLTAVQSTAGALTPAGFGGAYQTQDGVIHLGLTNAAAASFADQLKAQYPSLTIQTFPAQYSWAELLAIANTLSNQLTDNPAGPMVSVTPDVQTNTVSVGFTDVNAPQAAAIKSQYGPAVEIISDEPGELLAADICRQHAYPDRAKYHQPGYAGLCIDIPAGTRRVPKGRACTSGFGMHLPGSSPNGPYDAEGFFTAGHCVVDNVPSQLWNQGGSTFGQYVNNAFRNRSSADAGSIVTDNTSTLTYRESSNLVALAPGTPPLKITQREARNAGQPGPIELSGAITGEDFGVLDKDSGGEGSTRLFNYGNGTVALRHIYTATMDKPLFPGDSGAPVFQGPFSNDDGTALGIVSGANPKNHKIVYYSQIAWVEFNLGWITNTSSTS